MDIEHIRQRVTQIESYFKDGENDLAHIEEDRLYTDFVQFVATIGQEPLPSMAAEVLKTRDLNSEGCIYDRWYA